MTGQPDAALGGVYKLSEYNGEPRIKLSENIIKVSLPSKKQVFRVIDEHGMFFGADAVGLVSEEKITRMYHPFDTNKSLDLQDYQQDPLLKLVMKDGKGTIPKKSVIEIATYTKERLKLLPLEYQRFQNPHIYKIGLSEKLKSLRDQLIAEHMF